MGVELVPAGALVEDLRRVKDAGEVDRIRARVRDRRRRVPVAAAAAGATASTERQFALALEFAMRERGASGNSFDPIIASGPNGAKPHHVPSDRVIERNELVVCDFGCIVDGYCSDMTRTVSVGDPGPDARQLYDVVLESQQAGRAMVARRRARAPRSTARRATSSPTRAGPRRSRTRPVTASVSRSTRRRGSRRPADDTLLVGDVVTVEPGVYLPGVGGVRIEDTVVVRRDRRRAPDPHLQGSRAVSISTTT